MIEKLSRLIELATPIIRIIFPEQRRWIVFAFVTAGLPLLTNPLWEPFASALLLRYLDVKLNIEQTTALGISITGVGLALHIFNILQDRRNQTGVRPALKELDRKSLITLFEQIHIPTIQDYINYGKTSMAYMPALHFQIGVEAVISSPTFRINNLEIKKAVNDFVYSLTKSADFGIFFHETSHSDLKKFFIPHNGSGREEAKRAHEEFMEQIFQTEAALMALCRLVLQIFPDFDFDSTNLRALQDYRKHGGTSMNVDQQSLQHGMEANQKECSEYQDIAKPKFTIRETGFSSGENEWLTYTFKVSNEGGAAFNLKIMYNEKIIKSPSTLNRDMSTNIKVSIPKPVPSSIDLYVVCADKNGKTYQNHFFGIREISGFKFAGNM